MASVMKYFKKIEGSFVFIGKKLEIRIPRRYENYNLLSAQNVVQTLAIFEMIFDDNEYHGFLLPAVITIEPSNVYNKTINETDFLIVELQAGDKFMTSSILLKQPHISYAMFVEFISLGNLPKFMDYESTAFLFDRTKEVCDANLRVQHSVFEMIYSHLFRDPDDLTVKYRHTDMTKKPEFIELRSVTYGTDSTTAKIVGAYMNDGINAAIVNPSHQNHELEDLLRK